MISKHRLNLLAFAEPLSKEAKYWIGFLLADGCIGSNKGYATIGLTLKFSDIEHIRKFARFVGVLEESVLEFKAMTTFGEQHGAKLLFTGKELVLQLAKYGIVPRKSGREIVPDILSLDIDFWRGMVDGDGCISIDKLGRPLISFAGSFQAVSKFRDFLQTIACVANSHTNAEKPYLLPNKSIFQTGLGTRRARDLITALYYSGCDPVLARKMAIAEKCKLWRIGT
jgi:hypothetical protein